MPTVPCSYPGCNYTADNENSAIVAALISAHAISHSKQDSVKKPDRPELQGEMNESEWLEAQFTWNSYKTDAGNMTIKTEVVSTNTPDDLNAVNTTKPDKIRSELLASCSKQIRSRLYQAKGEALSTISETDLLEAIREAAVNKITTNMHRNQFANLQQEPGEGPQAFLARIRSKSTLCKFNIKAKCSQSCTKDQEVTHCYAKDAIESQLISGLLNPDHRDKLLVDGDQHPTFNDKMKVLDTLHTHEASTAGAATRTDGRKYSQYKQDKNKRRCGCGKFIESSNEKHTSCTECFQKLKTKNCSCGTKIHPSRKKCAACVRKSKKEEAKSNKTEGAEGEESITFGLRADDELNSQESGEFTPSELKTQRTWMRRKALDAARKAREAGQEWARLLTVKVGPKFPHSNWNGKKFVPSKPMPQPMIRVRVAPMKNAMEAWRRQVGLSSKKEELGAYESVVTEFSSLHPTSDVQLADTGAQTCSVTEDLCLTMGIGRSDFLPTGMNITGATGASLDVLGCVLLKIWTETGSTHQVAYVVDNTAGNVISREALIELGIIHKNFPNAMADVNNNQANNTSKSNSITSVCDCPERTATPPMPEKLPVPATPENRIITGNQLSTCATTRQCRP